MAKRSTGAREKVCGKATAASVVTAISTILRIRVWAASSTISRARVAARLARFTKTNARLSPTKADSDPFRNHETGVTEMISEPTTRRQAPPDQFVEEKIATVERPGEQEGDLGRAEIQLARAARPEHGLEEDRQEDQRQVGGRAAGRIREVRPTSHEERDAHQEHRIEPGDADEEDE